MHEIKKQAEDFIVEEITPEGEVLSIDKAYSFKESEGEHLICVMVKKNWDLQLAIKKIAKHFGVSASRIGFAGTKDKKAITSQRISLWNIKKEQAENLKTKDIELKPLYYSNERIELGDLQGNHFRIKVYADEMKEVPEKIPNYFGEQRFGTTRPITHLVGEQIIRGETEKAVKIYLAKDYPSESEEARSARQRLAKDYDYKKALKYFPLYLKFERTMLAHLAEHYNDYAGALRKLPKFLKIMFTHSYQSHLFNKYLDRVKGKNYEDGPLYGFELELKNNDEKKVLEEENLELSDFKVKSMPEMSSKGMRRDLFIKLKNFKVIEKTDEYYLISFDLPKGTYATTVIDFLFS